MTNTLVLPQLDGLPQAPALARLTEALWRHGDIVALWLTGSLARGAADALSDIDLHIAVKPEALDAWRQPDLAAAGIPIAGGHFQVMRFGEQSFLHQVVLPDGDVVDFLVQSSSVDPMPDQIFIVGCRDAAFGERLSGLVEPVRYQASAADPAVVRQLVVDFWIGSLKHAKVLSRDLEALAQIGLSYERTTLIRLWSIEAFGLDHGARGGTIHSLTPMVRAVAKFVGPRAIELLGQPLRTRLEIVAGIEAHRDEVAQTGRRLAATLGFAYPSDLEAVARRKWDDFLSSAVA